MINGTIIHVEIQRNDILSHFSFVSAEDTFEFERGIKYIFFKAFTNVHYVCATIYELSFYDSRCLPMCRKTFSRVFSAIF